MGNDDFPDWQKGVMAFKAGDVEMTDDYPDWVRGVAVESGSKVGGGSVLIDIGIGSQYYDSKSGSISLYTGNYCEKHWQSSLGGFADQSDTGYIIIDITDLLIDLANPVILLHLGLCFYLGGIFTTGYRAYADVSFWNVGGPARIGGFCTNEICDFGSFPTGGTSFKQYQHHYQDLTAYKEDKLRIEYSHSIKSAGLYIGSYMRLSSYIELFDAKG